MDWKRTFAFHDAHLEQSPFVNSMSDIDGHQVNVPGRRQPLGTFTLFNFSAKFDPVPSMLVQNHRAVVNDFFGVTTSFNKAVLKPGVTILANEEGAPWVKYIHGDYGKGTWTYYGGHDPEDPQHADRQSADGSLAVQEFAGISADSQQRVVPGREEEAVEDLKNDAGAVN